MDPFVMAALKRRRKAQLAERMQAPAWQPVKATGDLDSDLVFTTEVGSPIDPANLRPTFRRMAWKAGIPGDWTVYSLDGAGGLALPGLGGYAVAVVVAT